MKAQDLTKVFDLENKLFLCLIYMKSKGVRLDVEKAHKLKSTLV